MDHREFGEQQSRVYRDTIIQAIAELGEGADVAGSKARDEIIPGLRTWREDAAAEVTC
jgi:toxin ParE1/3/4